MRQADKDIYYNDIVIKSVDQESQREIEMLILEQEAKDGVQENRRRVDSGNP